ncbi:MAG TPA: hypothetical protein VHV55_22690 [Pirellulales bacterium]|jgi:hypothetical protein|nr:hypothetical protein [Pirellulales bacterium]
MKPSREPAKRRFRLWIGNTGGWRPRCWRDVPPRFVAWEPADSRAYSARHALAFLEGFNGQMLAGRGRLWAVAVAIDVLDGETFAPGRLFSGRELHRDGPLRKVRRRRKASSSTVDVASSPQPTLRFVRALQTAR